MPVNTIICHYLTKRQNDVVSLQQNKDQTHPVPPCKGG